MAAKSGAGLILGLDLGVGSVGWALMKTKNGVPCSCLALGSRVFEAAAEGNLAAGKDESPNVIRRMARMLRRQTERRARRRIKLANVLQKGGLLPDGPLDTLEARHRFFVNLDARIRKQYKEEAPAEFVHTFPYWLRARALDAKLEPGELGRALYHLGQRRGFLSNRKAAAKEDEEKGKVKPAIEDLKCDIKSSGSRTLGEFLSRTNPADPTGRRIRERWTSRQMYKDEFNAIWDSQRKFHPDLLTDELRNRVFQAIFFQRPLKIQKHLIGLCQFEYKGRKPRRRAPFALLAAQRFRVLQKVNDLRIVAPDFSERELRSDERGRLLEQLESHEELKFDRIRRILKLDPQSKFNLERGGEKRLVGNRTNAKLRKIFGKSWESFTGETREKIVNEIRSYSSEKALAERGMRHYGLNEELARKFGAVKLDAGYCSLSRQALEKMLPVMEEGTRYATAVKEVYGDEASAAVVSFLPSLRGAVAQQLVPEVRNPVVSRVLTEMRKVVNGVIRKYGKPDLIRVELARDLKKSREERKRIWKRNRERGKRRTGAAEQIIQEIGDGQPSRKDIELVLLYEECGGECPYTGKHISLTNLLSGESRFDVEHIIPFSRCLDDSFLNKTLCLHEENRSVKRNKIPWEAYGDSEERWDEIVERVKRFKGDARTAKLRRFLTKDLADLDGQCSRMLNDTRYSSRLAGQYLGLLFGSKHREHIQVSSGMVTAYLRDIWNLNKILGDGGLKNREDHRHHAIDAVVIALTGPRVVKELSRAASRVPIEKRRKLGDVALPWDGFLQDLQGLVDEMLVSHRVSRKVNGRLHEDTFYSRKPDADERKGCVHVRKRLDLLSPEDVKNIVDPMVAEAVLRKLEETTGDPKKTFASKDNHPSLRSKSGKTVPIHKVRIAKRQQTFQVGNCGRERHVTNDGNHHMEVLAVVDAKGKTKWEALMVSQFDAMTRHKNGESIVNRNHGNGKSFVFSISSGELFVLEEEGMDHLYVARTISNGNVEYAGVNDSRKKDDIKRSGDWKKKSVDKLRQLNCRKVLVTPLGEVRWAND